ncbi:MAG: ABC transporter permease [Chloroflexi bacterium]|nr:ABC transporter permease [Chloroflexota bacterium]
MKPFWALLKRELASVARERTILIAVLIQLFIASFSSALLLGLLSLYDPDSVDVTARVNLRVGVVGALGDALAPFLDARGLRVVKFENVAEARKGYAMQLIDALVVAPDTKAEVVTLQLYLPRAEARASLIQLVLQEPLKRYENVLRAEHGIVTRYNDLKGTPPTTFEFLYSVILPVLLFFPAFVAGNLVADSLSEEFELNTLETLLAAPVSWHSIVGAKITAAVILSVLQGALWLGLLLLNGTALQNVPLLLAMGGLLAGLFGVTAALVAVLFKNREQAQFVYALVLMGGIGVSFLLGVSPLTTISRLAIGDAFTGAGNVLLFASALGVMVVALSLALTRRASR